MAPFTVAVAQMTTVSHKQKNLAKAEAMIAEAAQKGAKLIVFPEEMHYMGPYSPDVREEVPDGESCRRLSEAAKKHGIWVHTGTMKETGPDPYKSYNTSILFSPAGEMAAKYRKIHLCDIIGSPGVVNRESDRRMAGDQVVVADTELGKIGLAICYDIRFPELFRLMALQGAQIICLPACFLAATGPDHWEVLLRATAIQNHCYILASDQGGVRENGTRNWGHSMIIDPWGTVIARTGPEQEALLLAQIDLDYATELNERLGSIHNRREDVYQLSLK